MRPMTITSSDRQSERTAWPTPTPGLVVQQATSAAKLCTHPSWRVTHLRSGLDVCCCLLSPEAALGFAVALGGWDWTANAVDLYPDERRWKAASRARERYEGAAHGPNRQTTAERYSDINGVAGSES